MILKRHLKTIKLTVVVFLLLCIVLLFVPGQMCILNSKTGNEDCTSQPILFVFFWQTIKFLNDFGVAFTTMATVAIAVFTYTLWKTTGGQLKILKDEFVATHRPKIICRKVFVIGPNPDRPVEVNYTLANIGNGKATIISGKTEVLVVNRSERRLNFVMAHNPVTDTMQEHFEVGQSKSFLHMADMPWNQNIIAGVPAQECWFQGRFVYRDERGVEREMAFSRKYDFLTFRFPHSDDPELDYAD